MSRPPHIDEALARVAEIRAQVARSAFYRGYRAVPVGLTGLAALATAIVQAVWFSAAGARVHAVGWVAVAAVCAVGVGLDVALRRRRDTLAAVGQLVPALVVGLVVTIALWSQPERLPGLWTMVFGLGVLASRPYLPRAVLGIALFYVAAGVAMTLATRPGEPLSPWAMGLTFGVGQLVSAATLWREVEREEGP